MNLGGGGQYSTTTKEIHVSEVIHHTKGKLLELRYDWHHFSECSEESTRAVIWAQSFLWGKVFSYGFNFFKTHSTIQISHFFLCFLWNSFFSSKYLNILAKSMLLFPLIFFLMPGRCGITSFLPFLILVSCVSFSFSWVVFPGILNFSWYFQRASFFVVVVVYKFIYYFIYFWLCWVFVAACGLSLLAASRGYSLLRCAGLLQWLLLLWSTGSRCVGFSSCGTRAQQLWLVGSRAQAQ